MHSADNSHENTLVSVVIPTYNRAHSISRAIHSVLAQSHRNLELIVADDASSDNTEEVVNAIDDPRVIYVRHSSNAGAGSARNLGIRHSKGDYIAFQDSDDEWLVNTLEIQLSALLDESDDYGAVFGMKITMGRDETFAYGPRRVIVHPHWSREIVSEDTKRQLLKGNFISPQTLMIRKDVFNSIGGFDSRLPNNEDWDFMMRMSRVTKVKFVEQPVVVAHISSDSIHRASKKSAISFLMILKKHLHEFSAEPKTLALWYFRTGRSLQKLGRFNGAYICMLKSLKYHPANIKMFAGCCLLVSIMLSKKLIGSFTKS